MNIIFVGKTVRGFVYSLDGDGKLLLSKDGKSHGAFCVRGGAQPLSPRLMEQLEALGLVGSDYLAYGALCVSRMDAAKINAAWELYTESRNPVKMVE